MIDFGVGVILPSAGNGERMGSALPKQYTHVLGKPLFLYALEEFNKISWITKIVLVVDNIKYVENILSEHGTARKKILIAQGEKTRHRSIRVGLESLQMQDLNFRVVVVHDAVRPIVPHDLIEDLVLNAAKYGASGATRPLVSTVVAADDTGFFKESLKRDEYFASETPQAFLMEFLATAYNKCTDEDLDHGTECLQLVLSYAGVNAKLIQGPPDLWKVTHKKDLYTATGCLREKANKVCIMASEETNAVRLLTETLSTKVSKVSRYVTESDSAIKDSFNSIVIFHVGEIALVSHLIDFAAILDIEKPGLIVHVIEEPSAEGMQNMTAYDLHQNGCNMARHYRKLLKSVVVIHCVSPDQNVEMVHLISNLILTEHNVFTGQTFFL